MLDLQAARFTVDGTVPVQEGNHHPTLVPMGCYESADGHVNVAGPSGRLLHRFCAAIGLPDLPSDPRFATSADRSANRVAMNELIGERLRTRTTADWVETLNGAGVPCGPVNRIDETFADPQVRHLAMTATVQHAALGPLDIVRNAVTMTGAGPSVRSPAPDPGEHGDEILAELGLRETEIAALRDGGVI